MTTTTSRRDFIRKFFAIGLLGLLFPFLGRFGKAFAADPVPTGMQPVSETDPVAAAVGYKQDVKDIDFVKYPNRKKPDGKKQFCENCSFYTTAGKGWGKCQILASGVVASKGWCGSWQKKA